MEIQAFFDEMSKKEFKEFIAEYTAEQQEYLQAKYKPTKKQQHQQDIQIKRYLKHK